MIGRPFLIFSREYILTWWIFQSMIHWNLHFQCVFHQKEQKTFNLSTLLLGLAPGKFQYFGILKLQTKRYKNSGIFHSRKKHKAQEYPWSMDLFMFFLQLSISRGHNCPCFYSAFRCQDVWFLCQGLGWPTYGLWVQGFTDEVMSSAHRWRRRSC